MTEFAESRAREICAAYGFVELEEDEDASTLGEPLPDVNQATAQYQGLQNQIQQQLSLWGYSGVPTDPTTDIGAAIQSYTGMTTGQMAMAGQAISAVLSGKNPAEVMGPIVGAAMLASGVAAPVAAVVGAGLALLPGLMSALAPQVDCQGGYFVGSSASWSGKLGSSGSVSPICISHPRARAPKNPDGSANPNWEDLITFIGSVRGHLNWSDAFQAGAETGPAGANIGLYRQIVNIELPRLYRTDAPGLLRALGYDPHTGARVGDPKPPPGDLPLEDQFYLAFDQAWRVNAENVLNGHPGVPLAELLSAVVAGWNATHYATPALTIPESQGYVTSENDPQVRTTDPVVQILLSGHLDGNEYGSIVIHGGPSIVRLPGGVAVVQRPAQSSAASTGVKVAIGLTAVGALGWLALGRPNLSLAALKAAIRAFA